MEVVGGGKVTAPTANAAIATIAASSLPAARYNISVSGATGGTAAADAANMALLSIDSVGPVTTTLLSPIEHGTNGQAGPVPPVVVENVLLDGTTQLQVQAIGAGTASIVYSADIVCERVGDYTGAPGFAVN